MRKTPISIAVIVTLLSGFMPLSAFNVRAEEQTKTVQCITTGYYSPLPGQSFYVKGSLAADKILNGNGTNGADGTEVYQGMIAAPKNIPFGTKIDIPGVGTGTVHDRGGAIKVLENNGEPVYRFDIWFGKGEEGLLRALQWGVRKSTCQVYYDPALVDESLIFPPVQQIIKNQQTPSNSPNTTRSLKLGMKGDDVSDLQQKLYDSGYLAAQPTGYFGAQTQQAVIDFQLQKGIISSAGGYGSGIVGPQTQKQLAQITASENQQPQTPSENEEPSTNPNLANDLFSETSFVIAAGLGKDATGDEVKKLQLLLASLNYYEGRIDGEYNYETIDAVLEFQKDHDIIQHEQDYGAGYFGTKTQQALVDTIVQIISNVQSYPQETSVQFGYIEEKAQQDYNFMLASQPIFAPASIENQLAFGAYNISESNTQQTREHFVFEIPTEHAFVLNSFFYNDLKLKDKGTEIARMQETLKELGFFPPNTAITGYFGQITKDAVINFQKQYNIENNKEGIFDLETRRVVNKLMLR